MQLELWHIVIALAVFAFVSTWLLKKFTSLETHLVYSIWRIRAFSDFIKRQKRFCPFVDIVSRLGLVLGFGVFGSDFLFGRKKSKPVRIAIIVFTAALLGTFYYFTLLPATMIAPVTATFWPLLAASFSLLGVSGFIFFALATTALDIVLRFFAGKPSLPGVGPLLPGVKVPGMPIFIPWYGWIAIFFSMVVHEASHGIQMIREKIRIENAGFLLAGLFPLGAFVEPDEAQMQAKSGEKQAMVYSAGPSANFFSLIPLVLAAMLFSSFFVAPAYNAYFSEKNAWVEGVSVSSVPREISIAPGKAIPSPAYGKLEEGMQILAVEGTAINSNSGLFSELAGHRFEETEFLVKENGVEKTVSIVPEDLMGRYGFETEEKLGEGYPAEKIESLFGNYLFVAEIGRFLGVMWLIALLLGVANFMPLVPFDGGKIATILYSPVLKPFVKKKRKRERLLKKFFLYSMLVFLLVNMFPLFL